VSVKATAVTPSKAPPLTSTALRRIADAGVAAQARGASFVRLTLRPAHLGTLSIDLAMRGSVLHGKIRTETAAARDLILSQVDRLREALEERGIRVGDFQVQVERPPRRPDEDDRSAVKGGTSGSEDGARVRSVRRHVLDVLA
jgi:flagellar hook-length control protein FliK